MKKTNLKIKFLKELEKYEIDNYSVYDTAGGEVALFKSLDFAIVYTDGRYPKEVDQFSYNQYCTEIVTVLYGFAIIEYKDDLVCLKAGESLKIEPLNKYSIAGKALCTVDISPKWDKKQNSYIQ